MKREIKFRAKDEFSDSFIYGQAFFVDSDNNQGYITGGIDRHHAVKKETVSQYTGLKDKNGKEIYEGDILKSINNSCGNIMLTPVVGYWSGSFIISCAKTGNHEYLHHYETNTEIEVIGNIRK